MTALQPRAATQLLASVALIARWRTAQNRPAPFVWNGINYLLKMPSDLAFVGQWDRSAATPGVYEPTAALSEWASADSRCESWRISSENVSIAKPGTDAG